MDTEATVTGFHCNPCYGLFLGLGGEREELRHNSQSMSTAKASHALHRTNAWQMSKEQLCNEKRLKRRLPRITLENSSLASF